MIRRFALAALTVLAAGCEDPYLPYLDVNGGSDPFSSREATLLDFEFEGELTTTSSWSQRQQIEGQLLYTIGHLNWDDSVGRLDKLSLTNIRSESIGGGLYRVTYDVKMPVAWGSKTNLPTSYELVLPKRADYLGLDEFTDKYKEDCVDWGAHDVDSGSMWYYYRPQRSGCALAPEHVVRLTAAVTVSPENTTGKYPEYHEVWKDDSLDVVAIFGKYEDGATTSADAGISAYNRFLAGVKQTLGTGLTTVPATVPSNPGVSMPDVTFTKTYADGRTVTITALLVDNVRTAGPSFDTRYNALSLTADMIFYNGHAGLGSNVRALANKGQFVAGKYQIFFMNGCDTFAYVDGALAQKKAALNPDDPNGTKYLDMVTNAMPSFFSEMPTASMAFVKALLAKDAPMKYEDIFAGIDSDEVVVVTGEEDNVYVPGYDPDEENGGEAWGGMEVAGSVNQGQDARHQTPTLPAGRYVFTLTHDPMSPGEGDADLYVRTGLAPTTSSWECRPYVDGSDEECRVTLDAPAVVHLMVRGYSAGASAYVLTGNPE